jgi:hypothetical protein
MCQLTFSDLGKLNKIYLNNQLVLNALDNNPDGVGLVTEGNMWKSHLDASIITNFGTCINNIVKEDPVLAHVRLASNKTLNKVEHSHPFKGKILTQIHNGKLEAEDYKLMDRTKVDSECFLNYLENLWEKDSKLSFPEILTKAMKDWKGKFALMYHVAVDNEYYIARGKEAELHYTFVNGRLVINTEKDTLEIGLRFLDQLHQILHKKALNIDDIKEVDEESIFKFDRKNSKLEKVGEIEEEPIPAYTVWQSSGVVAKTSTSHTETQTLHESLEHALFTTQLSMEEADYLSLIIMGKSLVELSRTELSDFIDYGMDLISDYISPNMATLYAALRKEGKIRKAYEEGLDFPWMFNSYDNFLNILEAVGVSTKIKDSD